MKKILLILSFITLTSMSYGQTNVYHKFLGSNVEWTGRYDGYQNQSCYTFKYNSFSSDTASLGGATYYLFSLDKTIYPPYFSGPMAGICNFTGNAGGGSYDYPGFLREDTIQRKVYFLDIDSIHEKLLYDFTLNVGDTVKSNATQQYCNPIIVTQIDSIFINGNFRKRWTVNSGGCLGNGKIIEGIGSLFGLLEPMSNFEHWGALECYSDNLITLYSTNSNCPVLPTGIKNIPQSNSALIAPNPAKNSITISQTEPSFNRYEIYALNGKLISENKIIELIQKIDLLGYAEGMYIVKLIGNQKVEFKKIVVVE